MLELLLFPGEVFCLINGALADHHIRLAFQDRAYQLFDICAAVLVVGVCVDDKPQTGIQSSHKATCQPLVPTERYHMVKAQLPCLLHGVVLTAVVDDKVFDGVDAVNMPGQVVVCQFQRLLFVITWDLYNQFHFSPFLSPYAAANSRFFSGIPKSRTSAGLTVLADHSSDCNVITFAPSFSRSPEMSRETD